VTDIVIKAENLGKKYTTGHQTERNRDWPCATSTQSFRHLPFAILPSPPEAVWALKDVSFRDPARGLCAKVWYHRDKDKLEDQREKRSHCHGVKVNENHK